MIDHRGEAGESAQFRYWGVWLGGVWAEDVEGTNGIGTCIAERRPVTVHRPRHFRAREDRRPCLQPFNGCNSVHTTSLSMDGPDRGTGLNIVDALVRSMKGRLVLRSGASGTRACVVLPDQSLEKRAVERQLSEVRQMPANLCKARTFMHCGGTMPEEKRLLVG